MNNFSVNVLQAGRWIKLSEFQTIDDCRQFLFDTNKLAIISSDCLPMPGFIFNLNPDRLISLDGNLYIIREIF